MIISEKHAVQSGETTRNLLGLNYKSAALPLSYAGENAAHINARFQLKQVADPMRATLKLEFRILLSTNG
jgi:hypothetical protein